MVSGSPIWPNGDSERLPDSLSVPEWHYRAACAELDVAEADRLFFPKVGQSVEPARAICRECPVLAECREWALSQGENLHGVWGGTAPGERKRLRRGAA